MATTKKQHPVDKHPKSHKKLIDIILEGTKAIMFDRFTSTKAKAVQVPDKLYLSDPDADGNQTVYLPYLNIMSFLSATNTASAPKKVLDKKVYKDFGGDCLSHIDIQPLKIPFARLADEVSVSDFVVLDHKAKEALVLKHKDDVSKIYVDHSVARLNKGIPNDKIRPVVPLPWFLHFTVEFTETENLTPDQLQNVMRAGGKIVGLGTWRPVYGQFKIKKFDVSDVEENMDIED
jgi:hypothetical protein